MVSMNKALANRKHQIFKSNGKKSNCSTVVQCTVLFPLQKWLHKCGTMLQLYIAYLVLYHYDVKFFTDGANTLLN